MNRTDIETRMQLTAVLCIQPAGQAPAWLNIGDLAGHKRTIEREGAEVSKAEKGYHRKMRSFTAQVGYMFEFKLREQFQLNTPMLMAALDVTYVNSVGASPIVAPAGTATFSTVTLGRSYFIIASLAPYGVLNTVVVKVGGTTYVENTDYTIDLGSGELYLLPGGSIAPGANVAVTFGAAADTNGFLVYAAGNGIYSSGALTDAGQKTGLIKLLEFDQHAAGGVPRRIQSFTGQYWCEGDADHDGKKPVELMLKILAVDKPAVSVLK